MDASDVLVEMGVEIIPDLVALLESENNFAQHCSAACLGRIGGNKIEDTLLEYFNKSEQNDFYTYHLPLQRSARKIYDDIIYKRINSRLGVEHLDFLGEESLNFLGGIIKYGHEGFDQFMLDIYHDERRLENHKQSHREIFKHNIRKLLPKS